MAYKINRVYQERQAVDVPAFKGDVQFFTDRSFVKAMDADVGEMLRALGVTQLTKHVPLYFLRGDNGWAILAVHQGAEGEAKHPRERIPEDSPGWGEWDARQARGGGRRD
jgi:hypothetical protein